jgi:predicted transcriptional regulator YdeE
MQPKISAVKQIILVGMSFYGDPFDLHSGWDEENEIGRLWKRWMSYLAAHPETPRLALQTNALYEVHIYNEETRQKGLFEVFAGMECDPEQLASIPVELSVKVLPLTRYAVFTFSGEEISSDWEKVIQDWLAQSGYRGEHAYNFQYYDSRFKGMDRLAESILDVYVPIAEAA